VVLDERQSPLAGAEVRIDLGGAGPEAVTTDDAGRWGFAGIAAGRWHVVVHAKGYLDGEGHLDVSKRSGEDVRIELQREEVRTKNALNGRYDEIAAWIAEGNRLLDRGEYEGARGQFEKAVALLPASGRPEVLSSIARTWYLQGAKEKAAETLERALRLRPNDVSLRALLESILGELGRADEATRFLTSLREDPAATETVELPREIQALIDAPVEPLRRGRTGQFHARIEDSSKWSTLGRFIERTGETREAIRSSDPDVAERIDLSRETYQVFVPDNYAEGRGFGVLVWISPGSFGGLVKPETKALLAERKLIWIGADNSGNERWVWDRWRLAIDAATAIEGAYDIDPERVYVGGYSGGGRVSSWLTLLMPDVFRGGLFQYGADDWMSHPVPDRPGTSFAASFARPSERVLRRVRAHNRFVFVEGEFDVNRVEARLVHAHYRDEGFAKLTWFEIPGASHFTPMPPTWFRCALEALDAPVERCEAAE